MHYRIFIVLLLFFSAAEGQTIEVLKTSAETNIAKAKDFAFIEPVTDTNNITFAATIKAAGTGKESGIEWLFLKIKAKANELGANGFKLNHYQHNDSAKSATLILDTYIYSDSLLKMNFENHEKNNVYILGSAEKTDKSYSFKINNEKKEIKGGTFYYYHNNEGEEVKINKGGFAGASIWIKWEKDKPSYFLTLTGFGLGGGPVPSNVAGVAFNTGRINIVERNLGHLLLLLLTPSE